MDKIRAIQEDEFDIINNTEDAPQIVGIVDEGGAPDFSDKARWRIIADYGMGEISIRKNTLNKRDEDEDEDLSIPRKSPSSSEDESRRRRNVRSEKKKKKQDSDDDLSPPRSKKYKFSKRRDSPDLDLIRRKSRQESPRRSKDKRMTKTLDGKTAGLQDAKALREETAAHKRREAEIFEKVLFILKLIIITNLQNILQIHV